jgi:hypothetical protein
MKCDKIKELSKTNSICKTVFQEERTKTFLYKRGEKGGIEIQ